MAEITYTAAQIGLVDPLKAEVKSYIAAVAITKGQAVYLTATGTAGVADANAAGLQQFRGIALNSVGAGQAVDVLHAGELYGFNLAALNVGAFAFLSNDAGKLDDGAGAMTVRCGRVSRLADSNATKVLRVFVQWEADWA
jgi:hypothetical protein